MTTKKYSIITFISIATLVLILIYSFCINSTKAYADEITEATVITDSATQADSNIVVQTARKAPVSIAVYSNEVTESSDTYDFTKKQPNNPIIDDGRPAVPQIPTDGSQPEQPTGFVITTPAPENPVVEQPFITRDPQSTAAPDATPEPDIISYPPTIAPEYKD